MTIEKTSPAPAAEDAALDRVLAAARPVADAAREAALLDRIVAAAERSPRIVAVASPALAAADRPVVRLVEKSHSPIPASRRPATPLAAAKQPLWRGRSASLLAASLLLGLALGQTAAIERAWHGFEDMTGLALTSAFDDAALTLASAVTGSESGLED